jgi:excisionase family DNA binding protein
MSGLALSVPDELVEAVAERAAEIVLSRLPVSDGYLDVDGAAAFLACSKNRIYALTSSQRIPHYKDGSRLLFDRSELREFVRKGGAIRA